MPIFENDVKFYASQRMTDTADGGGPMTSTEIVDGSHNAIFSDISDVDRAHGVVNIMSLHATSKNPANDVFQGANIGLQEIPSDENVEITLMSINDPYLLRGDAQEIIERYLVKGTQYQGELLSTQLTGQRAIRLIQRTSVKPPVAGEVLCLTNKSLGEEQYVKIESKSIDDQEFYNGSTFIRRVVTCIITEPLRFDFVGVAPHPNNPSSSTSSVHETMIADASKYYGTKMLTADATLGDNYVKVDSIYNHLVPSARLDTPHVNQPMFDTIDVTTPINESGSKTAVVPSSVESHSIAITPENQGYVYTATLVPMPEIGTTKIKYMVQGKWYELIDDGTGTIKGADSSYGVAQLDELGNLSITTGALPDNDTIILVQYVAKVGRTQLVSEIGFDRTVNFTFPQQVNSNNCVISFDGKTANIVDGIVAETDEIESGSFSTTGGTLIFKTMPSSDTDFVFDWQASTGATKGYLRNKHTVTADENNQIIMPELIGATYVNIEAAIPHPSDTTFTPYMLYAVGNMHTGTVSDRYDKTFGVASFNATNGVIQLSSATRPVSFVKTLTMPAPKLSWTATVTSYVTREFASEEISLTLASSIDLTINTLIEETILPFAAGTLTVKSDALTFQIAVDDNYIFEDTLDVAFNGQSYVEAEGKLFMGTTEVGTIDIATGVAEITQWSSGTGVFAINAGLLVDERAPRTQSCSFITSGSPVASRSLQVNAKNIDGSPINATTNSDGIITGDGFEGYINIKLGIVEILSSDWLDTNTVFYNCVSYNYLPLDKDQLGLDPIRLPSDGKVSIYRKGYLGVISEDRAINVTVTAGEVIQLDTVRLTTCTSDAPDAVFNLDAGTVTFPTAGSYLINYRFEDMLMIADVDISGLIRFTGQLSHSYSTTAKLASVILGGNWWARYTNLFDQKTWTGQWSDNLIGDDSDAQFNDVDYPIVVADGCITEEWAIIFTSSTNFKLLGKNLGQIATGDINTDFAPNNPNTGTPYFILPKLGWGQGWATGNVLRGSFFGAVYQLNVIRTILQGESEAPLESDKFALQIRGNINKEVA